MARRPFLPLGFILLALTASASARAAGGFNFSAVPAPTSGQSLGYLNLSLEPGQTHHSAVTITNTSKSSETLRVGAARGTTASGSGVTYVGAFAPCVGTGCWISGLPRSVTLAAGAKKTIPVTVTVPAGASPKQYLAAIAIQPAGGGTLTKLGSSHGAAVQAIIIHQVNVGVAITVGALTTLTSRLRVASITSTIVTNFPRLLVRIQNTGQTFTHAKGTAACTSGGKTLTFPLLSDTVLPGEGANLGANARDLPAGKSVRCTAELAYERGQTTATPAPVTVKVPSIKKVKSVNIAPGVYAEVPTQPGMPTWAYVLIGLGGAVLLALLVVAVLLLRRRTPTPAPAPVAPDEAPPESPGAPEAD